MDVFVSMRCIHETVVTFSRCGPLWNVYSVCSCILIFLTCTEMTALDISSINVTMNVSDLLSDLNLMLVGWLTFSETGANQFELLQRGGDMSCTLAARQYSDLLALLHTSANSSTTSRESKVQTHSGKELTSGKPLICSPAPRKGEVKKERRMAEEEEEEEEKAFE